MTLLIWSTSSYSLTWPMNETICSSSSINATWSYESLAKNKDVIFGYTNILYSNGTGGGESGALSADVSKRSKNEDSDANERWDE